MQWVPSLGALVAVWYSAGFAIRRLQVRISAGATSHQGLLSLPSSGVGKWIPAIAGKAKAGMAHSDCRWTCGCASKTVKSHENMCHSWALLRWWSTMKRRYIKCISYLTFMFNVSKCPMSKDIAISHTLWPKSEFEIWIWSNLKC